MVCIGYQKVCNMIPKIWIIECLKMYKISDKVINFTKAMNNWRVKLAAGGQTMSEVKIKKASSRVIHSCHCYLLKE